MAWSLWVLLLACAVGTRALDCTFDGALGKLAFTAMQCPGNASCVVAASAADRTAQQMFIPVGCCPQALPVPCVTNTSTWTKLHGCCPLGQVCCVANMPNVNYMMGCAEDVSQCCLDRICPPGYSCCVSGTSVTCCPNNMLCRGKDYAVPIEGLGFNSTRAKVSTFFPDITDDQLCIPIHVTNDLNLTFGPDGIPTLYPLNVTFYEYNVRSGGTLYYAQGAYRSPNVTACGRGFCYDDDVCVHRYRNVTKPRIFRSPEFACRTAPMGDPVSWQAGCYHLGYEEEVASYPAGCCPVDTTPCGAHSYTFTPYVVNTHASSFLYQQLFACANENETCCFPYVCPMGAKCCTARRAINGVLINETALAELFGERMLATANEGHNYCCPEDAVCCEFVPRVAYTTQAASRRPKSLPFCGTDETCTRDYYSPNRKLFDPQYVQVATPFAPGQNWFTDEVAKRTALGIVGNPTYYTQNSSKLSQTCYYTIDVDGDTNDVTFFDITCEVLNSGNTSSPAQVPFAGNFAPYDQLAIEFNRGGPIVCPPNAPAPWCVMP